MTAKILSILLLISTFLLNPGAYAAVISNGLVGYWEAEGNANDTSPSGNNGILQGDATFAAGSQGSGFSFDGDGDYVAMGDVLDLGTSSLTIAAWVNMDAIPTNGGAIARKGLTGVSSPAEAGYGLTVQNTGLVTFGVHDATQTFNAESSNALDLGRFTHVAGVLDRTAQVLRLFIDGSLISTTSFGPLGSLDSNAPFAIGALDRPNANPTVAFFNGRIDEVVVYNRALSSVEIGEVMDATVPDPALLWLLSLGAFGLAWRRSGRRALHQVMSGAVLAAWLVPASAAVVVVDFEDLTPGVGLTDPIVEDGFIGTPTLGSYQIFEHNPGDPTLLRFFSGTNTIRFETQSGALFDLLGITITDVGSGTLVSSAGGFAALSVVNPDLSGTEWTALSFIEIQFSPGDDLSIDDFTADVSSVPANPMWSLLIGALAWLRLRGQRHGG